MSPVVKKKGEKFTLPGKYLLFILTILCAGLMILTFTTSAISTPLSYAAGFLVVPFEEGIAKVGHHISDHVAMFQKIEALVAENNDLKQQVADLTNENIALQQERFELSSLRELYELDSQYQQFEKIGARIIAKDSGNWFNTFLINKGSDDGIELNMNVMAGAGLVGRITAVGPNWSRVVSIISDNSSVSGMVLSTSDNIIVNGNLESYENGVIDFSKLADDKQAVVEGDKIVTSSISDYYLPGILIGYIYDINVDSNNLTRSGHVTPAVNFANLQEVLVVKEVKQTVNEK